MENKRREQLRAADKRRYAKHIVKERLRARRRNWQGKGIDVTAAEQALSSHAGMCEICETTTPGGRGTWHVDHDHDTGKIRGVLCLRCNAGLGLLQDSIRVLKRALIYLERT